MWLNRAHDWAEGTRRGRKESGKGKDSGKKGKSKDGKGTGGGKQNDKGKGVGNPHAGKQCRICHKYGHIAADCWWKIGSVEGQEEQGDANQEPVAGTGGSSAVGSVAPFSFDNVIFAIGDSSIAAINNSRDQHLVLVDSGACENVAKSGGF